MSKSELVEKMVEDLFNNDFVDLGNFQSYEDAFKLCEKVIISRLEDYHIIQGELLK